MADLIVIRLNRIEFSDVAIGRRGSDVTGKVCDEEEEEPLGWRKLGTGKHE